MYKITDQTGKHLDSGSTRSQVVTAIQRLLSDPQYKVPRLPKIGREVIIALPQNKYIGITALYITVI